MANIINVTCKAFDGLSREEQIKKYEQFKNDTRDFLIEVEKYKEQQRVKEAEQSTSVV